MADNVLAPNGLSLSRNYLAAAPTYQGNLYYIKSAYATAIGRGDAVKTGTAGNQGYVVSAVPADTALLGIFNAVQPFYSSALQGVSHGLNGSWVASTTSTDDIPCLIYDDPFAEFIAQVNGGVYDQTWRGLNISFATGTNGAPNFTGQSTLVLDYASLNTTNTLPFRILGAAGVAGGPQDPNNTYPWVIVKMNTAEVLNPTGI